MDEARRARILDEARASVERLAHIRKSDPVAAERLDDPLSKWRRGVEAQEAEFAAARAARKAASDRERDDAAAWREWVGSEISGAVRGLARALGEILAEKLDQVGDAIAERDRQIAKLEVDLAKQAAQAARLEARLIENEINSDRSKVIDLPALPTRKGLN